MPTLRLLCLAFVVSLTAFSARADEPNPVARWPLGAHQEDTNGRFTSTSASVTTADGPTGEADGASRFDGRSSLITAVPKQPFHLGRGDFSIALWVNADSRGDDLPGDLVSQYDPDARTGFHLGLYSHGGVTNGQPNSRQLHFGIDQARIEPRFTDHGQLGSAVLVFSMCVHRGQLYAATCHAGPDEAGHVFRFEGGDRWTDLGSPDAANAVSAMAVHNGELYVASSKYILAGSALSESQNPNTGGKVFRLGADDQWIACGTLSADTQAVSSLVSFRGELYAASLYRPAGFFRYAGGETWMPVATPDGKRVEATIVHNGALYATSYDEAAIFRFDGSTWEHLGTLPESTQTYGFAVHRGDLYVSEWPRARVFRFEEPRSWVDVGRLGEELESMPLLVYNGKMYGGTLPLAEVYRFDRDHEWSRIGRVDETPDVKYRRAWSMAVYQGRLFVGALPSGRVMSIEAGRNVTWDHEFPSGWHHVAAVRDGNRLRLHVDGELVAESVPFEPGDFDLTTQAPLQIGFGAQDHFQGRLSDVRIYQQALRPDELRALISP